jgi:heme-degrading monooxygenase HmoA
MNEGVHAMYMRVTKGHIKAGCWEPYEAAYIKYVEGPPAPAGLLGRWLLRAASDPDLGFSLSLWDTQEAMEAYERSDAVRGEILPRLAPYIASDFVAHHCDVKLQAESLSRRGGQLSGQ